MKIVFLGDAHWGARANSDFFLRKQIKFYNDVFFPYLLENKIDLVIQFGDLLEQRKFINIRTLAALRKHYLQWFEDNDVNQIIIQGNHDVVHNNTNRISALTEIVGADFPHSRVVTDGETVGPFEGDCCIDLIPWMNKENTDEILEFINKSSSDILIGHLEINGFEMVTGIDCHHGLNMNMFKQYKTVYSGHFHKQSIKGNIHYIGTPYELNWGDYGHHKGFHVFDTELKSTEFVANPEPIHQKIMYNDEQVDYDTLNVLPYTDVIVKIIVESKKNDLMFDRLLSKLNTVVYELFVTDFDSFDVSGELVEEIDVEDSLSILIKAVDGITTNLDKQAIKKKIMSIHKEAEDQMVAA